MGAPFFVGCFVWARPRRAYGVTGGVWKSPFLVGTARRA